MNIGSFSKNGDSYTGSIQTLSLTAPLRLEPNSSTSPNAPDFRVKGAGWEVGYGYQKLSESGVDYIAIVLDDPTLAHPIYASLFLNSEANEFPLVWNRRKPKAA